MSAFREQIKILILIILACLLSIFQAFIADRVSFDILIQRTWVVVFVTIMLCTVFLFPKPKYYGTVGVCSLILSGIMAFLNLDFYGLRKWAVLLFMLGLFLIFDAIDNQRNADSFIQRVSKGELSIIYVVLIISFIIGFIMEEWNHKINYWIYPPENYPIPTITIINVPFIIYLGWIFWILALIEMVKVLSPTFASIVWRGPPRKKDNTSMRN